MEALYLLGSIAATFFTSAFLSLFLALRSLSLLFSGPASPAASGAVQLYEGHVRHVRLRPAHHAFEYPVRYALIDLDSAPQPSRLAADRAREVAGANGPVFLLTIPASVGYEQNPLSVYYCYECEEQDGKSTTWLKMCIAEVTNTPWGEKVLFSFNPESDMVAKPLHVSPFMDMLGNWSIRATSPGVELSLVISVQHPTLGKYFTAALSAKRINSSCSPLKLALYFWLMPHKVAIWIYWQALKLWWKSVAFLDHPKYYTPVYRADALKRDADLRCSRNDEPNESGLPNCAIYAEKGSRWCIWRDAQWPWS